MHECILLAGGYFVLFFIFYRVHLTVV